MEVFGDGGCKREYCEAEHRDYKRHVSALNLREGAEDQRAECESEDVEGYAKGAYLPADTIYLHHCGHGGGEDTTRECNDHCAETQDGRNIDPFPHGPVEGIKRIIRAIEVDILFDCHLVWQIFNNVSGYRL